MEQLSVEPTTSFARPGDAWLRHQRARIEQRHLQFGRHSRLEMKAQDVALAIACPPVEAGFALPSPAAVDPVFVLIVVTAKGFPT